MRKNILLFALLLLALPALIFGQDTYDYTVNFEPGIDYIRYYGTVDMSSDATGNHYTQAFLIGNANAVDGGVKVICSDVTGVEDVNGFIEYSDDLKNWKVGATDTNLDSISIVLKATLIGKVGANDETLFHTSKWARLKLDGQTGNPGTTVTWSVFVSKNDFAHNNGRMIPAATTANKK